jgi:hypothetical protein
MERDVRLQGLQQRRQLPAAQPQDHGQRHLLGRRYCRRSKAIIPKHILHALN